MIEEAIHTEQGDLVVNIGPQHPATHGVLHLVITLNGETIRKVEPHLGYIHRSIEKMCESLSYRQFNYVTSRMDYLSSHINNHGCALLVEKAMQIEVPFSAERELRSRHPGLGCGQSASLYSAISWTVC